MVEIKQTQEKLKQFVGTGQLGVFASGYWGHPAMKLPPDVNLLAATHYLQALEYQRIANRIVAILGSKTPHIQNPVSYTHLDVYKRQATPWAVWR